MNATGHLVLVNSGSNNVNIYSVTLQLGLGPISIPILFIGLPSAIIGAMVGTLKAYDKWGPTITARKIKRESKNWARFQFGNETPRDRHNLDQMEAKYHAYELGRYPKGNYSSPEGFIRAFSEDKAFIFKLRKDYGPIFNRRIAPVICNSVILLISLLFGDFIWAIIVGVILVIQLIFALIALPATISSFAIVSPTGVLLGGRSTTYMPWREVANVQVGTLNYRQTSSIAHSLHLTSVTGQKIIIPVEGCDTSELVFGDKVLGLATLVQTYWDLGRESMVTPETLKQEEILDLIHGAEITGASDEWISEEDPLVASGGATSQRSQQYVSMGITLSRTGKLQEAESFLEKALLESSSSIFCHYNLVVFRLRSDQFPAVEKLLWHLMTLLKQHPKPWNLIGYCLYREGRVKLACEAYKQAVYCGAIDQLGHLLLRKGEVERQLLKVGDAPEFDTLKQETTEMHKKLSIELEVLAARLKTRPF